MSDKRVVRTVRRGGVVDDTQVDGNLVRVKKAKFISLVGLPANQTAIKVTRSDESKTEEKPTPTKRLRRSDAQPVLRLTFPEGTDQDGVATALKLYGMESYTVSEADGIYTATRSDLKSISKDGTQNIKLTEDGLTATVSRSSPVDGGEVGSKLAIASLTFNAEKFTSDDAIKTWLAENSVDGELADGGVVHRSDIPENEETRQMEIADGVTATIVRSDVNGVPEGFIAIVSEAAYGGWGWGQLDFSAMMADVVFSEQAREAVRYLEDVLRNIMFYSDLPLDVRKTLMNDALTQFGAYMSNMLDALPKQLMISVVRSEKPQQEKEMTKAATTASPEVKTQTPAAASSGGQSTEAVTRAEMDTISKAISDLTALVKRSVPLTDEEKAAQAAAEEAKPITRADLARELAAAKKPLEDEIAALKGTTIVRSTDTTQDTKDETKTEDKNAKRADVFGGAFGNFAGVRN